MEAKSFYSRVIDMVQIFQAKNGSLHELRDRFGLELTEDAQFFSEWQDNLPKLTEEEKHRLDRVRLSFSNLLEYPPLLENTPIVIEVKNKITGFRPLAGKWLSGTIWMKFWLKCQRMAMFPSPCGEMVVRDWS